MSRFVTISGLVLFVFVVALACMWHSEAHANVLAGQLRITNPGGETFDGNLSDGSGAEFWFFLNDTASVITVSVIAAGSGVPVAEIDGGAMGRGLNMVAWDGAGAESSGEYWFQVTAEQPNASTTEWTMFYDSGDIDIFTRGHVVYTDQSDPDFGLIKSANDGGPLGTGINIFNPDGSPHDPFLVAADASSGGTINYGGNAPLFAVLDSTGRIYVSNEDLGQVLRINRDYSADLLIDGLAFPKGLYAEGAGEDFTLYICADNKVLRANVGAADTFAPADADTVAEFSGFFPQQVILDDAGAMYVTLRVSNDIGSDGKGIRKYNISGALPVTDDDADWFLMEDRTFIANDLLLDRGADRTTSSDDILYYNTRAGSNNSGDGIWRIDDINSFFPDTVRVITENAFYSADDNVNARSTIDFDAAGNIIFMENANEHVFFFAPPGSGETNSFTTTSAAPFMVDLPSSVQDNSSVPDGYLLAQNYPNPFNPNTAINYTLGQSAQTRIQVFNVLGELVRTLVDGHQLAGEYTVSWDGKNDAGIPVPSGVYILTLKSGDFARSQRMTLLK